MTDHDCVLEDGVHLDCGAIIKGSRIPEGERIPMWSGDRKTKEKVMRKEKSRKKRVFELGVKL